MTPEEFEALLTFLDPDRDRAGDLYEVIRARLVRLFEWRGCSTPEELADETINRVARQIAKGLDIHADNPYSYFYGVARLVLKEFMRKREREQQALAAVPPARPVWPEDPQEDQRLEAILVCLADLTEEQRQLLLRYHGDDDRIRGRRELAEELGVGLNALRIRAHRLRRDVEECVNLRLLGRR